MIVGIVVDNLAELKSRIVVDKLAELDSRGWCIYRGDAAQIFVGGLLAWNRIPKYL